jgi:hypothetical protein
MTPDREQQRRAIDETGEVLTRLARDRTSARREDVDRAMAVLAEIEQHPASASLGHEAAMRLDQINRTLSTPTTIEP